MKRFSLFQLMAAVTLFAIGITAGWQTRGYTWQNKLDAEANKLAANTLTYYHFLPETGTLSVRHVQTLDLSESRQKQIFKILLDRNGIEAPCE